jgi:hypothetical protein
MLNRTAYSAFTHRNSIKRRPRRYGDGSRGRKLCECAELLQLGKTGHQNECAGGQIDLRRPEKTV